MPELANRCTELYGIDPHPFHDRVRARLAEHHVDARLAQGAAERLPYPDGLFDQAVAISSLEYVPDIEAACTEIRRVLRPGGRLAVVTPGANPLWDLALRLSTGESPGQYADRRQRLAPTLLRRFRLVEQLRIPRLSGPRTRLYTGLLLSS
jgi:SAM-dependent methyltransferase